ncbi:uncharacterized protein LOC126041954 [Accipiter gentilis]|uniref:uncharacterized protein LOC126041954 n=1 Tax=Astur gentilis TaxID=8957 RepID=UPI0021101CD2|nr:uncharacterized protein LOC126041954 [Accipiter gentilis]
MSPPPWLRVPFPGDQGDAPVNPSYLQAQYGGDEEAVLLRLLRFYRPPRRLDGSGLRVLPGPLDGNGTQKGTARGNSDKLTKATPGVYSPGPVGPTALPCPVPENRGSGLECPHSTGGKDRFGGIPRPVRRWDRLRLSGQGLQHRPPPRPRCQPRRESCSKLEGWRRRHRLLLTPLLSLSLPRWARWNGAAGNRHTGRGGGNGGSPPPPSVPTTGIRPVLPKGCGAEEKPPRCFDHRGPAASLTGDGNGAKRPQQKGAPKPAWAEPQEDHPPHSTLALDIKGWRSPVGYRGLDFPARGSRQAGRRLLLARVCSGKVVRGYRGRAGLVASLHGKRSACRAKRGKFSFAPPRMLESPSPLLDGAAARQHTGGFADCTPQSGHRDVSQVTDGNKDMKRCHHVPGGKRPGTKHGSR